MANTNALIFGGITLIVGILTIPLLIGCAIAPLGLLILLIGLLSSNPAPPSVIVSQPGYQQPAQQYQQPAQQYQQPAQQYQQPPGNFPQQPKL